MGKREAKKRKTEVKRKSSEKRPLKVFLPIPVFLMAVGLIFLFFTNSRYFKIDTVEIVDINRASKVDESSLSKLYKGRNIFFVDLVELSAKIKKEHPAIKDAVVKRVMPNKLEINIIPRIPVAKIKANDYFPIDSSGIVLLPGTESDNLPVIIGFSSFQIPRPGQKLESHKLQIALELVSALNENAFILEDRVTVIDASNARNLLFYLGNGIEVRIGGEDFVKRLKRLKEIFARPSLDTRGIKYIDLRFKDVVIGPK